MKRLTKRNFITCGNMSLFLKLIFTVRKGTFITKWTFLISLPVFAHFCFTFRLVGSRWFFWTLYIWIFVCIYLINLNYRFVRIFVFKLFFLSYVNAVKIYFYWWWRANRTRIIRKRAQGWLDWVFGSCCSTWTMKMRSLVVILSWGIFWWNVCIF